MSQQDDSMAVVHAACRAWEDIYFFAFGLPGDVARLCAGDDISEMPRNFELEAPGKDRLRVSFLVDLNFKVSRQGASVMRTRDGAAVLRYLEGWWREQG